MLKKGKWLVISSVSRVSLRALAFRAAAPGGSDGLRRGPTNTHRVATWKKKKGCAD